MNYVYLIADTQHRWVKIGVSNDPFRRLTELNKGQAPFPLELIACFAEEDAYKVEKILHRKFAAQRTNSEWFQYSVVAEVIQTMAFLLASVDTKPAPTRDRERQPRVYPPQPELISKAEDDANFQQELYGTI